MSVHATDTPARQAFYDRISTKNLAPLIDASLSVVLACFYRLARAVVEPGLQEAGPRKIGSRKTGPRKTGPTKTGHFGGDRGNLATDKGGRR